MKGKSLFAQRMREKAQKAKQDNSSGFPSTFKITEPKIEEKSAQQEKAVKKNPQEATNIDTQIIQDKMTMSIEHIGAGRSHQVEQNTRESQEINDEQNYDNSGNGEQKFDVLSKKEADIISAKNMEMISKMDPTELEK